VFACVLLAWFLSLMMFSIEAWILAVDWVAKSVHGCECQDNEEEEDPNKS
jgi:hypothetical protein